MEVITIVVEVTIKDVVIVVVDSMLDELVTDVMLDDVVVDVLLDDVVVDVMLDDVVVDVMLEELVDELPVDFDGVGCAMLHADESIEEGNLFNCDGALLLDRFSTTGDQLRNLLTNGLLTSRRVLPEMLISKSVVQYCSNLVVPFINPTAC